jgi:hypothetical protein
MIDALRVVLGMRPLYRVDESSSHSRWARGLMQLALGDGNRRASSSRSSDQGGGAHERLPRAEYELELEPDKAKRRRKFKATTLRGMYTIAGHRVGRSFVTMGGRGS